MAIPDKSKYTNKILHSDIEARGFLDSIHSEKDVWCVVSRDDETDELFIFHDYPEYDNAKVMDEGVEHTIPPRTGTLIEGVRFWYLAGKNGSKLSVHNAATYDKPLIEKIWSKCEIADDVWVDTFIKSKIQYFDRKQMKGSKSPHGLLNYSLMEGNKKPTVEDFTVMNAFMLHRCIVDTKTQRYCYNYLKRESDKLKSELGIDFDAAYEMEFAYAKTCHAQETYGAKVDIEHINKCITYLDETTEALSAEIEPLLPPTCKANSARITRSELMQKLGWACDKIPEDVMESYEEDGVTMYKPTKPYYNPSTNFHRVEKQKYYSGFNLSYGESPSFKKKNELTTWIKDTHPDTKSKEWDIGFEEKETQLLNKNTCDYFGVEEGDTDYIAGSHTRVTFTPSTMTQHDITKGLLIREGIKWAEEWNFKKDSNKQMVKAEYDMVVSYPPKAAPENQIHYKVKKGEPIVTSPKFGEKEYEQLDTEIGKKIGLYNTLVHRRRYLSNPKDPDNKGLLSYVRDDGRIPAGLNNFGTATGRGAQRVIVNLPADGSVFGKEMRQCIVASEGKELVGIDQKSSQLSICALVTNNTSYYNAVATGVEFENKEDGSTNYVGTSAHCINARYFNLVTDEDWKEAVDKQHEDLIHSIVLSRKKSKGLSFASLFGCSFKKLAIMGGFPESDAKTKLKSFLDGMGLTPVIAFLEQCKVKYKRGNGFYIPSGFGYWVYCKSIHAAVNYLIQSLEGVVQKKAILLFEKSIIDNELVGKVHKILDVHDEILVEANIGLGVTVGKMACDAYTKAGVLLTDWYRDNLNLYPAGCYPEVVCDFAGGYAIGNNYGECH